MHLGTKTCFHSYGSSMQYRCVLNSVNEELAYPKQYAVQEKLGNENAGSPYTIFEHMAQELLKEDNSIILCKVKGSREKISQYVT